MLADRLAQALVALERIGRRLQSSLDDDGALFPVTPETVRSGRADAARAQDAFLQRFQQAGDHMLRKLFPRTVASLQGSADFLPIIDTLDVLHRAGLIDDPAIWGTLIDLRNRLIHDYALTDVELADDLNTAWSLAPVLIDQVARIRAYALDHSLLDGASLNDH